MRIRDGFGTPVLGLPKRSDRKADEVLTSETIRDVGRALPWLASEPQTESVPPGMSADERAKLLDAHAKGLRQRYDSLYPVIDRAGRKLAAALDELNPAEIADPEGEGTEALETAEAYFHAQREDLHRLNRALVEAGAPRDHDAFEALARLDRLYAWIVATMQEIRWTVLIDEGVRTPPTARTFTSGADLVAALDD